jgi:copper homeostasis protein
MPNSSILEICVESVNRAVAAEQGGADRIELCRDLYSGGVTPSAATMQAARRQVRIPIHVLIRPRSGDFLYSDREFESMKGDIGMAKEVGMDGIVLGLLDKNGQVDRERTRVLVKLAHPLPVTFHRAFDLCQDLNASLHAVMEAGATRLLTAGGKTGVSNGVSTLAGLIAAAGEHIVIMPGGGIRASNVERILCQTGAREIHTSLSTPHKPTNHGSQFAEGTRRRRDRDAAEFEARVRKFRRLIESFSAKQSQASRH